VTAAAWCIVILLVGAFVGWLLGAMSNPYDLDDDEEEAYTWKDRRK
jgi:hypothetical protein